MTTKPANTVDPIAQFKQAQKDDWKHFGPLESVTTVSAARLVRFAGVEPGMYLLDAGCGTGVVAITAARLGAMLEAEKALRNSSRTSLFRAQRAMYCF